MSDAKPQAASAAPVAGRALPLLASGWRWLPLSALIVLADHAAKAWIMHHFSLFERVHVLPVLDIILTYNTGAAFSFLSQASGWQRWLFVALALVVSVVLIAWLRRLNARRHGLLACGLALIVGGALVITRMRADHTGVFWIRAGATSALIAVAVQSLFETSLRTPADGVLFAVIAAIALHERRESGRHHHPASGSERRSREGLTSQDDALTLG